MNPTPEQIERLPKWAQAHIKDLDRQRRVAIDALKQFQDSNEPTMVSYEKMRHLDGEVQFLTRYIDARSVEFVAAGVSLEVTLPIDECERGIKLSWGPEGSISLGDLCFTPTSYQQARITNMAYMPREYESLVRRKKRAEEKTT